jgi:hypothetical protein
LGPGAAFQPYFQPTQCRSFPHRWRLPVVGAA